jgi:hypothetical protein
MVAVCLLVAGVIRATLPTADFTLAWDHSVEKTRWEERYRVDTSWLTLTEARVQGLGAGMEPPPGAVLQGGWWRWQPKREPLAELRLTFSSFVPDYRLCWKRRCEELSTALGQRPSDGEVVEMRPCAGGAPPVEPGG